MTIATPLSLRWERAQHIDRSAIEPLGPQGRPGKRSDPRAVQPGSTWGPPYGLHRIRAISPGPVTQWMTPSFGTYFPLIREICAVLLSEPGPFILHRPYARARSPISIGR
jgi:hypothetical protein